MPDKYYVCNEYGKDKGWFHEANIMDIANCFPGGITKGDICRHLELETFDYALPMWWLVDVAKVTGMYVDAYFVWDYSTDNYNKPLPIRREGETILRIYNYIKEQRNN